MSRKGEKSLVTEALDLPMSKSISQVSGIIYALAEHLHRKGISSASHTFKQQYQNLAKKKMVTVIFKFLKNHRQDLKMMSQ